MNLLRRLFQVPELTGLALFGLITSSLILGAGSHLPNPPMLTHGPMVGLVESDRAYIWVRADRPGEVAVRYARAGGGWARETDSVRLGPDDTGVVELRGLEPNTDYKYTVVLNGTEIAPVYKQVFRTAPQESANTVVRLAFGAALGNASQPVWDALQNAEPGLFIFGGDSFALSGPRRAGQTPSDMDIRYHYRSSRSDDKLRRFLARTPTVAIWSDLDLGMPGANGKLPHKERMLQLFKEYWANGEYGTSDAPGIWGKVHYGPVDIFLLDTRYDQIPGKSMLGKAQLEWLFRELAGSQAVFKLIVSDPVWNPSSQEDDGWGAFPLEYHRLMDFIGQNQIKGVVLLSGGVRRLELHALRNPSLPYPLFELVSGRLGAPGEAVGCDTSVETRLACFPGPGFGLITANTEVSPPNITLQLVDASGQTLSQQVLTAVQLGYREGEAEALLEGYPWHGRMPER